ncbi:hypothetical protein DVH05_025611 [Phytophthora capsici]|nr:hypothetical protein DVH05_025611 [Phytophthora capsici]
MPLGTKCAHHGRTTVGQLRDDSGSPRQSGAGFGRADGGLTLEFRESAESGFCQERRRPDSGASPWEARGGQSGRTVTNGDGLALGHNGVRVLGLRTVDGTDSYEPFAIPVSCDE